MDSSTLEKTKEDLTRYHPWMEVGRDQDGKAICFASLHLSIRYALQVGLRTLAGEIVEYPEEAARIVLEKAHQDGAGPGLDWQKISGGRK